MPNINLNRQSNILLIDTSYYIFYRYYATLKWYTYNNEKKKTTFVDSDDDTGTGTGMETGTSTTTNNFTPVTNIPIIH